jgi:hypothetical protein
VVRPTFAPSPISGRFFVSVFFFFPKHFPLGELSSHPLVLAFFDRVLPAMNSPPQPMFACFACSFITGSFSSRPPSPLFQLPFVKQNDDEFAKALESSPWGKAMQMTGAILQSRVFVMRDPYSGGIFTNTLPLSLLLSAIPIFRLPRVACLRAMLFFTLRGFCRICRRRCFRYTGGFFAICPDGFFLRDGDPWTLFVCL